MPLNLADDGDPYLNGMNVTDLMGQRLGGIDSLFDLELQQQRDLDGLNLKAGMAPATQPGLNLGASIQPNDRPGWLNALQGISQSVEAFGAGVQGRTPLFIHQQEQDLRRAQIKEQAAYRKQMVANQIAQQQEQKRQHNWGIAEHLITSGNMDALEKFGEQFPDVIPIVQGVAKQDLADIPTFVERGYIPKEFAERILHPKPGEKPPTAGEIRGHVDMAKSMFKEDVKAEAKQHQLESALNTEPAKRRPSQQMLVDEHQSKLDVQEADIGLKNAQAKKALREAEDGPTDKGYGIDREAFTQQLFGAGVKYKSLQPEQMAQVNDRVATFQGTLSGNRETAKQRAQLNVPDKPSAAERGNLVDDVGTLSRIDSLHALYKQKYVGPLRGRIGAATEMLGGISDDEADFRAENATLKNQVIKMITGAQMSEPEAKRIMKQLPDPENPPNVYEARLKRSRENVLMMAKKRREILSQVGIDVSNLAPLPEGRPGHPAINSALDKVLGQ